MALLSTASSTITPKSMQVYQKTDLDKLGLKFGLDADQLLSMKAVAAVLPFRANNYVVEELIDWTNIPDDPIFQLTFPQQGMLSPADYSRMVDLIKSNADESKILQSAHEIQLGLNPHPAGQLELNVPKMHNEPLPGLQHKYRETVLFFPTPGQTCFSYCTYCFRWPQFVGLKGLKFASNEASTLVEYLKEHKEVRSVLFTGGDPLIMRTELMRKYIEPLLTPELSHITSIRIGTKALAFWPYRFVTDQDADDLLRLFDEVRESGRHLAIMAHFSHPKELETPAVEEAIRRIQATGAVIRCQAPLIKHVNDSAAVWSTMWRKQVAMSLVPYYMFVERDTGAKRYFEVPLARAVNIFNSAYIDLSGLGRTVRGPSMSCTPGKVMVLGVEEVNKEKVFVLKFIQSREPSWTNRIFFARFDPKATWMDDLKPAFGAKEFFFEPGMKGIKETGFAQVWTQPVKLNCSEKDNLSSLKRLA